MKRRRFNAGAAVSLVLSLSVLGVWIRSYWTLDMIFTMARPAQIVILSDRGLTNFTLGSSGETGHDIWDSWPPVEPSNWSYLIRFEWEVQSGPDGRTWLSLTQPHWFTALVLASPAIVWLAGRIRNRRGKTACPACGYDLRGTPGKECAECGANSSGR